MMPSVVVPALTTLIETISSDVTTWNGQSSIEEPVKSIQDD